jgi:hypothetical protein
MIKTSTKRLLKAIWYFVAALSIYIVSYYLCMVLTIVAMVIGLRGLDESIPFLCAFPISTVFFLFAIAGISNRKNITFFEKIEGNIIFKIRYRIREIALLILPFYIVGSFIYNQYPKLKYYQIEFYSFQNPCKDKIITLEDNMSLEKITFYRNPLATVSKNIIKENEYPYWQPSIKANKAQISGLYCSRSYPFTYYDECYYLVKLIDNNKTTAFISLNNINDKICSNIEPEKLKKKKLPIPYFRYIYEALKNFFINDTNKVENNPLSSPPIPDFMINSSNNSTKLQIK